MQEIWKQITGFDGKYYVSSLGNIRKDSRRVATTPNARRYGYKYANLHLGSERKNALVHRLVALYFIPNPDHKPCVNHIDFNVGNNRVDNLEWVTHQENSDHTIRAGRTSRARGEAAGNHKLTIDLVRLIRNDLASGMSNTAIAAKHGTNYSNVAHIKRGSRWGFTL